MAKRRSHQIPGLVHGLRHSETLGQVCGQGCGHQTPRTVVVRRHKSRTLEVIGIFTVGQHVHRVPRQVTAFGQDPGWP